MSLAAELSRAFHAIAAAEAPAPVSEHLRTLIIDALACMLAGADAESVAIAKAAVGTGVTGAGSATILSGGPPASAANAALVNGTLLRSLDFMDVYVDVDVCHPSESIPPALACAEANRASGRDFLDTVLAALAMQAHLASTIALHRNGLHHVGHAAWVVPLIAGRLRGLGEEGAGEALNLSASGLIVPEGFSRGEVANVKAMAFPLLAKRAIELTELASAGLRAQAQACEEVVRLLERLMGREIDLASLLLPADLGAVADITLKAYPAQYALQPLIAAGAAFRLQQADRVARIARIVVRAPQQTVRRTADPSKFRPASRETADHSLPFCVASGLLDGGLTVAGLQEGRWKDADVLQLMDRMTVEATGEDDAFAAEGQEIELTFDDGLSTRLDCTYPADGDSWRAIAIGKLAAFAGDRIDVERVVAIVETLEHEETVEPLIAALGADFDSRLRQPSAASTSCQDRRDRALKK